VPETLGIILKKRLIGDLVEYKQIGARWTEEITLKTNDKTRRDFKTFGKNFPQIRFETNFNKLGKPQKPNQLVINH
jgi:hypothetical protein